MSIKGNSKNDRLFTHHGATLNAEDFAAELKWGLDKLNKVLNSLIEKGNIDITKKNEIHIYFFPPIKSAKEYDAVITGIKKLKYDNSEEENELLRLIWFKSTPC